MVLEKGEQEREGGGALINREVEHLQYIFEKVTYLYKEVCILFTYSKMFGVPGLNLSM